MRYFLFTVLLLNTACNRSFSQQQPGFLPTLTVETDFGKTTLKIEKLDIQIAVTGNIASTTYDITFYNPFDHVLEGSFEFPLAEGQSIFRYGLDINGSLREGVVVEKQQARVAYENTVRKNVDPGLVEKTKGNSYRTRIYPIPAKGYKRVLIGVEQYMQYLDKELLFQLPVTSATPVKYLNVKAVVYNSVQPEIKGGTPDSFKFNKNKNDWYAEFHKNDFAPDLEIKFAIPFNSETGIMSFTGKHNGNNYFYLALPLQQQYLEKKTPSKITLLWDVSSSSDNRNIEKEIALLKDYFTRIDNTSVTLIPFNNVLGNAEIFSITNGNSAALIERIKKLNYDGGTQLGSIDLSSNNADQVLLFTDGISTFGKKEIVTGAAPIAVMNSSSTAEYAYMKYIAQQTHGVYINLNTISNDEAVLSLTNTPLQLISTNYKDNEIRDLYTSSNQSRSGISVAGILKTTASTITLNLGYGNTIVNSISYTITNDDDAIAAIPRCWATLAIENLEMLPARNKKMITDLGKEFSVVTSNTSLLVLDRVEDYVQYAVTPPADLKAEYDKLMQQKTAMENENKQQPLLQSISVMEELKKWYTTNYIKKVRTRNDNLKITTRNNFALAERMTNNTNGNTAQGLMTHYYNVADSSAMNMSANVPPQSNANASIQEVVVSTTRSSGTGEWKAEAEKEDDKNNGSYNATIDVKEWKPDADYLKQMEKSATADYYKTYLRLKPGYKNQPSFFVDIAGFFYKKGNKALALQVLSNVAELKLEDAELLRILGHQLQEWNENKLALETFKDVLEMQAEHPQSWRDLALAYTEDGNYQEAADKFYYILTNNWDSRFDKMNSVVLHEFNNIISNHKENINTSAYDSRLIYNMPVDVRIVITWSSDNSDIDLWVSDPLHEKCDYTFPLTEGGGRLSGDITQGFGPEEYCMKKAVNGNYIVEINYFGDHRQTLAGPISVKAELFTHYGTSQQKKQVINLRLTSQKEVIKLGELKF